jgi:hypothetical protein
MSQGANELVDMPYIAKTSKFLLMSAEQQNSCVITSVIILLTEINDHKLLSNYITLDMPSEKGRKTLPKVRRV